MAPRYCLIRKNLLGKGNIQKIEYISCIRDTLRPDYGTACQQEAAIIADPIKILSWCEALHRQLDGV
jgi:hypothetical protein